MHPILVISNDPALAETLQSELRGLTVKTVTVKEAASALQGENFRLIVADDDNSLEAALSALSSPVIRPMRPVRLSALLYTINERLQSKSTPTREEITLAPGYRFRPAERMLRSDAGDVHIALTEKEVELLVCLLEAPEKIVPRDVLLKRVWGYSDDIATHTLETHIYRLRGKLRQANENFDILSSEEGGYRFNVSG